MRETILTLAVATMCAVVLQLVDAQLHPDRGAAPPPPGAVVRMPAAFVQPTPQGAPGGFLIERGPPPPPDFVDDRLGDMMLR